MSNIKDVRLSYLISGKWRYINVNLFIKRLQINAACQTRPISEIMCGDHLPPPPYYPRIVVCMLASKPNFLGLMSLPKFLTHGVPLKRFTRQSSAVTEEICHAAELTFTLYTF